MIVVRFKVQAKPDRVKQLRTALQEVIGPSRKLDGVISFDIGSDLSDPNSFIATEVFTDEEALNRQEAQAEVAKVMGLLEASIVAPPEVTIFHVSKAESPSA